MRTPESDLLERAEWYQKQYHATMTDDQTKMTKEEEYLFFALVTAYRRIGIPVVKETLQIFMECNDKQTMVDRAWKWAREIR